MSQGADQKKRRLLIFLIFAPGIFFIVYWAATRSDTSPTDMVEPPPQNYVQLGQRLEYDGLGYRVYAGNKLFTDRIELQKNNLAIAEPGRVFVGLGMAVDNGVFEGNIQLVDSLGGLYMPLDAKKEVMVQTFGFKDGADRLFLFKVNSKAENYYIKLPNGGDRWWGFANTYQE